MTDRIEAKIERYRASTPASTDTERLRAKAEQAVATEDILLWAYYTTSDWTQAAVAAHVIEHPDERPSQAWISQIIEAVDEEILHRELSLGHAISGQWYTDDTELADIPDVQRRLVKQQLARTIVIADVSERLFWPESALTLADVPDWVAARIDVDPVSLKVAQYRNSKSISAKDLAPVVRERIETDTPTDDETER